MNWINEVITVGVLLGHWEPALADVEITNPIRCYEERRYASRYECCASHGDTAGQILSVFDLGAPPAKDSRRAGS